MRVLVTGGAGLLGSALLRAAPEGVEVHATERGTPVSGAEGYRVELADADAVRALWQRLRPDVVIHTAYDTRASDEEIRAATRNVARSSREAGAGLVHVSTDVVFDGEHSPYAETDRPAPLFPYAVRKAEAERTVLQEAPGAAVARTSLIIQADPPDRTTAWVLDGLRRGAPLRLFTDELRCPIAANDLAAQLWELAALPVPERAGAWHLVGPEAISRYALGLLIAARWGLDPRGITPARSADDPIPRPRDLRLLTTRADAALRTPARPVSAVLAPAGQHDWQRGAG